MLIKAWIGSPSYLLVMVCLMGLPQAVNESLSVDVDSSAGPRHSKEDLVHPNTGAIVLAAVNDVPIYDVDVDRFLQRFPALLDLPEQSLRMYRSTVLTQLIRKQVVLAYLQTTDYRATEQEVDLAVSEIESSLTARGQSLDAFLATGKADRAMLRRNVMWRIAWARYTGDYLCEENLRRYYEKHYERFDGTTRLVSHVYFGDPDDLDNVQWDVEFRRAVLLRDRIQQGDLAFEEAIQKYSQAPSAADDGHLGWIAYRGVLDPKLHEAIYSRPVGDMVGPVQTRLGIHLLKIVEEKRGDRPWEDMVAEIRDAAAVYLFTHVADRHLGNTRVQYLHDSESLEIDPALAERFGTALTQP